MTGIEKPFLVIYVPRFYKGDIVFQEHKPESKVMNCTIPEEIENYFSSDLSIEFHKVVSESGFDLRYEFKHADYGKILKTIKLIDHENAVIDSAFGYNLNMGELVKEMFGKLGMVRLRIKIRNKTSCNDSPIPENQNKEVELVEGI